MSGDILVLCYHGVSATWPSELAVTPHQLAEHVGRLVRRGYVGVRFSEVLDPTGPPLRVAVTFDDAYTSVHDDALPVLEELGVPGTVFVPTDFVGDPQPMRWPGIEDWTGSPHASELRCVSWEQLETLSARGWEVGSHTCRHPHLTQCGDGDLAEELARSREALTARLGGCTSVAYPYGDVDLRVAAAAAHAGYTAGATLPRRIRRPSPLAWPRVGLYRGDADWRYGLKVSRAVRAMRGRMPGGRLAGAAAAGKPSS